LDEDLVEDLDEDWGLERPFGEVFFELEDGISSEVLGFGLFNRDLDSDFDFFRDWAEGLVDGDGVEADLEADLVEDDDFNLEDFLAEFWGETSSWWSTFFEVGGEEEFFEDFLGTKDDGDVEERAFDVFDLVLG